MKTEMLLKYIILLVFAFSVHITYSQNIDSRPNIVIFIVDDMGWQDTSEPFWTEKTTLNNMFHTPNMERLAREGMKFTQAYASSICSPSRISLMTGMNAARHRVTNWTLRKDQTVDMNDEVLDFPRWNVNGLQPTDTVPRSVHATSLPQLLKDNGYHTIHVGKAHFGAMNTKGSDPLNLGFDVNIAGHAAGGPGSFLGTENFGNNKDGSIKEPWGVPGLEEFYGKDIFLTEALTQKALASLDDRPQKPFFLYMSHYAVHVPFYGDKRFLQKYLDKGLTKVEAQYASMLEGMDKSLGDILDYLDEKKLSNNTLFLFLSDNGAYAISNRGKIGEEHRWNAPLNSGKGSAYEGGIRIPMIVKWPQHVKSKTQTSYPVLLEDVFSTLTDVINSKNVAPQKIDGISFKSILTGSKVENRSKPLIWHYPNKWGETGRGIGASSTIRDADWKLIYYHKSGKKELFNIVKDIGEQNDVFLSEQKIAKKLSKKMGKYLRSIDAQMPTFKKTHKVVPWPDEI